MVKTSRRGTESDEEALRLATYARRLGASAPIILPGAELSGLELPGADLAGAKLRGADLSGADLAGAHLEGADLREAILLGANLAGADLTSADLRGADVAGAHVDDTVFTNTRLEGACISDWSGEPLSVTAALVDSRSLLRSELSLKQVAQLVIRGAYVDERCSAVLSLAPPSQRSVAYRVSGPWEDSVAPPSARSSSLPPSLRSPSAHPSILPLLRQAEAKAQLHRVTQESSEGPVSHRRRERMKALINPNQQQSQTFALAPQEPPVDEMQARDFSFPEPGEIYLGVRISHALLPGTTSRCFSGLTAAGKRAVVRIFDPYCEAAALQLPAFQRGIRALSGAQDLEPGVVPRLLSVAVDQTSYVATELPGLSLAERGERFRVGEACELLFDLAEAIAALHKRGVFVRSLKPSNVFRLDGRLCLSELDLTHLPTLAQLRGDVSGYAAYAAPEEIVGLGTRHASSDVFCLGALLEFLLTGEEPALCGGGLESTLRLDRVPAPIVELIRSAGREEPSERFQSVPDFLEELRRCRVVLG